MSGVLCPLCGQRSSYTGHVCWVEHPHVTATSESTNPISSMTIVTDNTAVIRAIEENNREIFVQRNEALEQLEPLKARIAELEAYKAKLEALRDVMASLIALFAAEPPRTDANIARILFERCVYWYGVDSSVPVTLDSITNLQCGECHLNVGEICDICGAMGEGK